MKRSFIPKVNKPGQFRPLTQPADKDRLVMDALVRLLNETWDSTFSERSHGVRPRRGTLSFIRAIKAWPPNDKLVQCDVEKCFDKLDHCLLLSFLNESCGALQA